jgi:glycosyltransferase involved in cell wall biosynthesis
MTFSIITVCYNAATTLEATLQSVAAQTCTDKEYIVVDGRSTDGTPALLARYAATINLLICEPDDGIYDAMNKGLRAASGDYVCFLNAGDTFHAPDTLQRLAESIASCAAPPDVLYGETAIVGADGRFLRMRRLRAPQDLTWRSFRQGMVVCHQAFYARTAIAPPYDLRYRYSSDVDWCIRVMKRATTLHNSGLVLADYLAEGATTRHRMASLVERFRIMAHHYGWLSAIGLHVGFVFRLLFKR